MCAWYVAGSSRHSISTVVFVDGINTPKCRVIAETSSVRDLHGPAGGRRFCDRVDEPVALHGKIEVDLEATAAAERVRRARVRLRHVVRLTGRRATRRDA